MSAATDQLTAEQMEAEMNEHSHGVHVDHMAILNQHRAILRLREFELRTCSDTSANAIRKMYSIWHRLKRPV